MSSKSPVTDTVRSLIDDAVNDRKMLALKASMACWAAARALDKAAARLVKR